MIKKLSPRLVALGVLALGLLLSAALSSWQGQHNARVLTETFDKQAEQVARQIERTMATYELGLLGARGMVLAVDPLHIDAHTFKVYADSRHVDREFPGVRGFGMIRRVTPQEEPQFLAATRRDGRPDFQIRKLAPHEGDEFIIDYIEPVSRNAQAVGLDIASERNRRTAALTAMQTGRATLTAPITLVQASGHPLRSFLLLLPIYKTGMDLSTVQARDAATFGWVYTPLVTDEVLKHIDYRHGGAIELSLSDRAGDADGQAFFSTPQATAPAAAHTQRTIQIPIYGRTWEMNARATPEFVAGLRLPSPQTLMLSGAAVSALCALLAGLMAGNARRTAALRSEQAHRNAIVEAAQDAMIGVALDGRILSWNPAAERIFGYSREEALDQPIDILRSPAHHAPHEPDVLAAIGQGQTVPAFDTVRRRRDGTLIDVAISVAPLRGLDGRLIGQGKTVRDISASKAAERALRELSAELERKVIERTASLDAARHDLRNILDSLPSMIGYWDRQLVNRFANRAYQTWFGVDPATLPGQHMRDVIGEELFTHNLTEVEAALRGEVRNFECELPRPDGQGPRHVLAHYLPDIIDGEVRGFYAMAHDITELRHSRQLAAAATRDSELLLKTINEHAIVSVADQAGRIVDANDAFCRISGYTRDELIGQDHRLINSGHHDKGFWREVWRSIASGQAWRGEVCNRAKQGNLYWVDSIIAPFMGDDGRVDKYISIRFDITAARAAQRSLRESEAFLDRTGQVAGIGGWEFDLQTQKIKWSPQVYRIHEVDPDVEPELTQALAFYPDEARRELQKALAQAIAQGAGWDLELPFVTRTGRQRWVRVVGEAEVREGRATRLLGAFQDITERKRSELELAESTSLLRRVLAAAAEVSVIATDPDLVIKVFNSGAQRMLGYRSEEVVGIATPELIHDPAEIEARAQALTQELGRPIVGPQVFIDPAVQGVPREWTYVHKDGHRTTVSLVVTDMRSDSGVLLGYLGLAHDVTRQKDHERSMHDAMTKAEQASLAKSQFLANMSHEIRTPMNAVMGLSYLLSQTALNTDQRDFVDRIKLASKSLLGVINDILDLSKIEAGELSMETMPFSPTSVLDELTRLMRGQAEDKGLRFDPPDLAALPPVLMGDPLRLNQVLTNLLSNAIKFTQRGHIALHAHVLAADTQQVRVRFEVQDSGIGISPEAAASLFQPFAQADTSITRRFGGTGLGLSIVKQLAEMMGGRVGVDSQPGEGSLFWVEIPFTPGDPAALATLNADQPSLGPTPLAGVRVLVVDDSQVNLDVAKRILELEGATVAMVSDGAAAVAYLRDHAAAIDVVLMDVQMPVMDGLTATQAIRSELHLQQLPIIALTAGAMTSERQQARDIGMNDFIGKPFDPRVVVDSICRLVPEAARAQHRSLTAAQPGHAQDARNTPATPTPSWPAIEGIAVDTVATRLGGDLKLFCTLLRNFMSEFASLTLPEGQPDRDVLAATGRVMHKLRGSAGNVGAQKVFELAAQAERACQQGQLAPLAQHIAALNAEIGGLQQGVERFLAQQEAAAAASTLNQGVADLDPQEVQRLVSMLRQHDVGALDQFDLLSASLQQRLGSDTVAQIHAKLTQLQFLDAADMLAEQGFA